MSTTQTSADDITAVHRDRTADVRRFRAATVEAALADARTELGDVEIVEANRIRRGGVGGFFATDLGVELVVRLAGSDGADRDGATMADPGGGEYVDSADVGRPTPAHHLPRAGARLTGARPPFYDRVLEEDPPRAAHQPVGADPVPGESITAELERLLTTATQTEQRRAGRPRSFASHLAEHLGQREDGPGDAASAARPEPLREEAEARPPSASSTPAPSAPAARTTDVAEQPEIAEPTNATAATDGPAATPARRGAAPTARDPWRRSVDLAAGAVGRLVEQLSDVVPVEGSRMRTLSRLTVSVTTPEGAVIELTAELEGDA